MTTFKHALNNRLVLKLCKLYNMLLWNLIYNVLSERHRKIDNGFLGRQEAQYTAQQEKTCTIFNRHNKPLAGKDWQDNWRPPV
jgi:hypothetical protein